MHVKILLEGDSAGGNLILALLSHISHPHPDPSIPRIDLGGQKLGNALLISPWVTFDTNASSMKSNARTDYILPGSLKRASGIFLGSAKEDFYNTPLDAPEDWWKDLRTENLSIIVSDAEILLDGVIAISEKIKVFEFSTCCPFKITNHADGSIGT